MIAATRNGRRSEETTTVQLTGGAIPRSLSLQSITEDVPMPSPLADRMAAGFREYLDAGFVLLPLATREFERGTIDRPDTLALSRYRTTAGECLDERDCAWCQQAGHVVADCPLLAAFGGEAA